MKKFFSVCLALLALGSTHATLVLHESFDRATGQLNVGVSNASTNNLTDWYNYSGSDNYIQVAEGSLSYEGYVSEGIGNKAELAGSGADDLRKFNAITSGHVYAAAIINVGTLNTSTVGYGTSDFFTLGTGVDGSARWCRLHGESVKEGEEYIGYKLGIEKYGEATEWAEDVFTINTNLLVVLEYEFVAGENNDIVRLYINPTAKTTVENADATCDATKASAKGDADNIAALYLVKSAKTPTLVYIDEIKVATAWADLFEDGGEGGGENPEPAKASISAPATLTFPSDYGVLFVGDTYTNKLSVKGENLTEVITLTCSTDELTLSTQTISVADAETGADVTVTLVPAEEASEQAKTATITLTSGDVEHIVNLSWYAKNVVKFADIATLKTEGAKVDAYTLLAKYTGEAVITFIQSSFGGTFYTIQDETGAANIEAPYWYGVDLGTKVTDILLYNGEESSSIQSFFAMETANVVEHDVTVEPQVVTLAELQANAADYLLELVLVQGVTLDRTVETFAQGNNAITQGENTANINLLANNELIDTKKPEKANVTGISSATSGTIIRPRTAADIVDVTEGPGTGLESIEADSKMEIYTILGQRVSTLQPGINIIRQGNTTYKVIR